MSLTDEHRPALHAIAARQGWQGVSRVIEEAVEYYLQHEREAEAARRAVAWSPAMADDMRRDVRKARQRWTRASSPARTS